MKFSKEGTITIITKNTTKFFNIEEEIIYQNRIHYIKLYNENMNLSILNCYFPTKVALRTKIIEILKKSIKNQNNIILGDFNFVESKLDTKNQYLF